MPRSLQARMLVLSGVAILAALLLAGWAIAGVLERFVTAGLDRRLDADIALLASTVDADGHVDRARLRERIGTIADGPGWRWRITGPDGALGSADFPALRPGPPAPPPPADAPQPRVLEGVEDGIPVHARQQIVATKRGPVTLVAAAPRDVVRQPIRAALAPLLGALAALAALLGAATLVQLRLGLRPLRRLRDQTAAIRSGARDRVDEDLPSELRGLAAELNALAADNEAALATARRSAANLAHALKTPVATLALDVRDDPARAALVARIDATIRHHLARARVEAVDRRAATPLAPAIADLATAVGRLHDRTVKVAADETLHVAVDPHDLDEMIGNLLDNAAKHARAAVRITAEADADPRRLRIIIDDDGPGIPADQRARVLQPGVRLDERREGDGFGLGIVAELAALYGGALALDDAPDAGTRATLLLPRR